MTADNEALRTKLAAVEGKATALEEQIRKNLPPPQYEVAGEIFIATKGGVSMKLGAVNVSLFPRDFIDGWLKERILEQATTLARIQRDLEPANKEMEEAFNAEMAAEQKYQEAQSAATVARGTDEVLKQAREAYRLHEICEAAKQTYSTKQAVVTAILALQAAAISGESFFVGLPTPSMATTTNSEGRFRFTVDRATNFVIAARAERVVADKTEHYYWMLPVPRPAGDHLELMLSNGNLSSVKRDSLIYTAQD